MRTRKNIDNEWYFYLGDAPGAVARDFDHSTWRVLDVPHDWSVEGSPHPDNPSQGEGGFFPGGIGWYRKELDIPVDPGAREILIEFDGVYMNSEVYCNGRFCGRRPYGYSSFYYDITPYVLPGETAIICVRVDNSRQKNSRWYTGSGIYRHVWLTIASTVRIDHWGTYVTTPEVSEDQATLRIVTTVLNHRTNRIDFEITSELCSNDGVSIGKVTSTTELEPGEKLDSENQLTLNAPRLWSPDDPYLYVLRTTVTSDGDIQDVYDTPCGIRSIRFDANNGFFLNDKNIKLKGVNEHHDAGCLGAAVPDDVLRRRFRILKEMGCNAIRIAHNPASPVFLDLCDEIGFLVVEDAFDEWREGKTDFGYQLYWDMWWERDLTDMIRRDRNHPSIIMWSVGNEIIEVREGKPEGLPLMAALQETCHQIDPTRPMTCGCCAIRKTNAAGYGPLMDVVGYNGGSGSCFDYEKDHVTYPERFMFASEVPHSLQTRGVYRTKSWYRDLAVNPDVERFVVPDFTENEVFTDFDDLYQSSYDNAMVRISSIDSWRLTNRLPYMCGEFRWSGFDYLGECPAWPAKSWNYGVIDLCGFPKDTYYFYQSQWSDKPMVHLLPHWSWPGMDGTMIPVVAYSNCERIELFLDDVSLGELEMGENLFLRWDVEYRPGTLRAVGRNQNDDAASCSLTTAGEAATVRLVCEEERIPGGRSGVAHVVTTIVDGNGVLIPNANVDVQFTVTGAGTLIGLENGDPVDSTNYKYNHRSTFHGMALAIVQSNESTDAIQITASSQGLASTTVEIPVD